MYEYFFFHCSIFFSLIVYSARIASIVLKVIQYLNICLLYGIKCLCLLHTYFNTRFYYKDIMSNVSILSMMLVVGFWLINFIKTRKNISEPMLIIHSMNRFLNLIQYFFLHCLWWSIRFILNIFNFYLHSAVFQ